MLRNSIIIAASVILLAVALVVLPHVIFVYKGSIGSKPIPSPITALAGSCPCGCASWSPTNTGFSSTITAFTMSTMNGYILVTPLVLLNTSTAGVITMTLSANTIVVSDYINGTQIYPGQGSISLRTGQNLLIQRLVLSGPVTSSFTLSGQYSYSPTTGVTYYYRFAEAINPPTSDIMNLLNGQAVWYVTHVYLGYNGSSGAFTNQWPVYYSASASPSNYWYYVLTSINQPVLELVPNARNVTGLMLWNSTYSGSTLTITVIGTYSGGTSLPGTGFVFYLFLPPITLTNYTSLSPSSYTTYSNSYTGTILLPPISKKTFALIIQWNPALTTSGQWNIIAYYQPGNATQSSHEVLAEGYGQGVVAPSPGDYICVSVTYYPTNNTVKGIAFNLNNGQISYFSFLLSSVTLRGTGEAFPVPSSGNYGFGVAASTGSSRTANWAIVYVNYQG